MSDSQLLKSVAERDHRETERNQLSRFDWLQCALDIFVNEGIDAVRITRLSEALAMTRGSFYWHFKDRQELVAALVSFWVEKNTPGLIRAIETAHTLEQGILGFFETTIDIEQFDARLDLAIREWARRESSIRKKLDQEDAKRIQALSEFYQRCGFVEKEALIRARVLYYSQIGFYALDVTETLETRLSYTDTYFQCFTGEMLSKNSETRFRNHIIKNYSEKLA